MQSQSCRALKKVLHEKNIKLALCVTLIRSALVQLMSTTEDDHNRLAHADLTAGIERNTGLQTARIIDLRKITPTIMWVQLQMAGQPLAFRPGQWVDFHVPGVPHVGGYSICSPPSQMIARRTFELAVKKSSYPPAVWLHEQASVGQEVAVQVGGKFFLSDEDLQQPLLCIAGGIGITPITSMITHYADKAGKDNRLAPALVLYSASTPGELALQESIQRASQQANGKLRATYYLTQSAADGLHMHLHRCHRIGRDDLRAALEELEGDAQRGSKSRVTAFLCGPPKMVDDLSQALTELDVARDSIRTEKWW